MLFRKSIFAILLALLIPACTAYRAPPAGQALHPVVPRHAVPVSRGAAPAQRTAPVMATTQTRQTRSPRRAPLESREQDIYEGVDAPRDPVRVDLYR